MLTGISILEIYFTTKLLYEVAENSQYGKNVIKIKTDLPHNSHNEYNMEFNNLHVAFPPLNNGAELLLRIWYTQYELLPTLLNIRIEADVLSMESKKFGNNV
jgi:hypothetical protein